MIPEHKKWMKRLQKCLSDMPDDCELVVEAGSLTSSTVHLLIRGKHNKLYEVHQDNMGLPISDNNTNNLYFFILLLEFEFPPNHLRFC